ncbi:MAG: helix-turn-helix domain-containing protein, partial [Myxococcota bacterium]
GRFDLAATARELGWSTRTLQRQAKDAGVELRATLQAARKALAVALLRDDALSLAAVAERLDYADERSFSRAFERWTGMTPTQWRRRK